jgi:predicted outer membrane protein
MKSDCNVDTLRADWTRSTAVRQRPDLPLRHLQGGAVETKMAAADQKFMAKAASGGKAEVELGRLASERGTSDAVKQFAQRMVTDHGKANEELTQLAQRKGIALPADLDAQAQAADRSFRCRVRPRLQPGDAA